MPFAPSDIFDLAVYEADDIGNVDTAPVSSWNKSSGSISGDMAQATGTNQPLLRTNFFNAKNIVRFDGTNDFLSWGDLSDLDFGTNPFAIFIVVTGEANNNYLLVKDDAAGSGNGIYFYVDAGNVYKYWNGSADITMGSRDASWHLIGLTRADTGASHAIPYYDGTAGTAGTESRTLSNAKVANLGCSSDGQNFFQGSVAAIYIASSVPSDANRNLFGGYIQTKYGLTIAGATFDSGGTTIEVQTTVTNVP